MKKMKYSFMTFQNKDGSKEWSKTPQFKQKASVEYLYLVIRDKDYPYGRVLLSCHPPEDEHERHENILSHNKFILDYRIKNEEQKQRKISEGYTLLNLQKDVIEVGAIRYDGEGNRYDFSRTRFHDQENADERRHTIDLVYTRIKKHMNQVAFRKMAEMEQKKTPEEKLALIYAPLQQDSEERKVFVLPDKARFSDFLQDKNMLPYRVFSIARLKKNPPEVTEMVTFEPYAYLDSQNKDMFLKTVSISAGLNPQILNKFLHSGR